MKEAAMSHTPEPWHIENEPMNIWSEDGLLIARAMGMFTSRTPGEVEANAARIVACVNFCRDVATERLLGYKLVQPPDNMGDEKLAEWIVKVGKIAGVEKTSL